ncbi:MAG TPA: pyridoxamine 5'-phosphate oxidase family protein [Anaerolineales bacterium]|nr:pyridoxamine 5'-phosphate oxidase family protein [Anaerolineales bacterium]
MNLPKIIRPTFPPGYVDKPASFLTWDWVAAQLAESRHYWLCSVRADGRPHAVPRWGVFIEYTFYYDGSPETRHAQNIVKNPHVSLHLENGEQAIILDGTSEPAGRPSPELGMKLSKAYRRKYREMGYSPKPDSWDKGGLYVFTPRQCIAWSNFTKDPTKFVFEGE